MKDVISIEGRILDYPLSLLAIPAGRDLSVTISGGCSPHVGSVSVGYITSGNPAVKTILLPEHRDDVISDSFALALSKATGGTVCVSCGIHYDRPSGQDINDIVECAETLLRKLIHRLQSDQRE